MLDVSDILDSRKTLGRGEETKVRARLSGQELSTLVGQMWGGKPVTLDGETPKLVTDVRGANGNISGGGEVVVHLTGIASPDSADGQAVSRD